MDIVRKEIDNTHYYWIDSQFAPSVSHVLDVGAPKEYGLLNFFKNNTPEDIEEITSKAKANGSLVHDACEKLLNGFEIEIKEWETRQKKMIVNFMSWVETYKPKNYLTEMTVGCLGDRPLGGTLDFVGDIEGEIAGEYELNLVDFKTNKTSIYYTNFLQATVYKYMYEQMTGEKVKRTRILRLGTKHKAGYEFVEVPSNITIDDFWRVYDTAVSITDGKILTPPVIDVYPDKVKLESISLRK